MKINIKLFIVLALFFTTLFGSQKQVDDIARVSAVSLYNIDKTSLETIIKSYLVNNPNVVALKIQETLTKDVYFEFYRKEQKLIFDVIPSSIKKEYKKYSSFAYYDEEIVGNIEAYIYDDNPTKLSLEESAWAKQNNKITVAVVDNYEPFDFRDKDGKLIGFHSDIAGIINKNLGINVVLKAYPSWNEAYTATLNGDVFGIMSLSWSKEREEKFFIYTSPYHRTPYHLVSYNKNFQSLEDLSNKTIAVEVNTIFKDLILEKIPNAKLLYVKSTKEAYESVRLGKADATISPNISDKLFQNASLQVVTEIFHKSSNLHIGINKKFPLAGSILSKGVDSISLKELTILKQMWLTKDKSIIKLTDEEKEWIVQNPTVKVLEFFDEPPFTLNTATKSGYIYELLSYLMQSAGLDIEYVKGYKSYQGMIDALEEGKVDILTTIPTVMNLPKDSSIVKSKTILRTPFVIIGRSGNAINSIEDLYGKRVAVVKGYLQDKYLSQFPKIKKVYVNNNDEGFQAIRQGKVNFYINNRANSEYLLNKSFATDLGIVYELPYDGFPPLSLSFGINGQKGLLPSILNKALEQIPYKKIRQIRERWLLVDGIDNMNTIYTQEEKKWLEKHPSIRLAYMDYWTTNQDGNNIHSDYINLLSKYGNLNLTMVKYGAWKEGFNDAIKGENVYGILNLSWSRERAEKYFDYSLPYAYTPGYIIVKDDTYTINSFTDLKNKSVYVKENAITNQLIEDSDLNILGIKLKTEEEIHKALSHKNTKAEALLTYVRDESLLEKYNLKVAHRFYNKFGEIHIGVNKQDKTLLGILDKAHQRIPKNELTKIQNKVYVQKDDTKVELSKQEKAFIKQHPILKVHNETNWPPFNFYEFGQPKGYSIDLMNLIAKNTGLNIEYVTGPTWNEFLEMMKKNELEIMLNIVKSEDRSKYMIFTDPFLNAFHGMAVHKDTNDIQSFKDIVDKKKNIILERGFFYHEHLAKNYPDIPLTLVDDGLETLTEVSLKSADVTLGIVPVMKYLSQKNYIPDLKFLTDRNEKFFEPIALRLATQKEYPELQSILQKGLASITPSDYKELAEKWLGETNVGNTVNINLTNKEKKWLQEHKTITFTADPKYLPYEAFTKEGQYVGMVAEYLKVIEKSLGITFEKVPTNSWSESLQKAISGEVDVLSNYTIDNALKDIHTSTKPYIISPISIITKNEIENGITLEQLENKNIAVVKGYGYLNNIFVKYPHLKYVEVDNAKEGLSGVSTGKYDAMICSMTLAHYKINELGLYNLHIAGQTGEVMKLGLGIRKDWDILVGLINKVIDSIDAGTKQEIVRKWLGNDFEIVKQVELTPNEQEWLNTNQAIKYVYDVNWAPFEWKNEIDEHSGIVYDILNLIEKRSGIHFEQVSTKDWAEAVKLMKENHADMYSAIGENNERKEYLNFTKNTIFSTPYVFVIRKNDQNDYFETFKAIKDKNVAVVDGYTIHGILKDKQPNLPLRTVQNLDEGFLSIRNSKNDIFIVNATTAKYFINRMGYDDLKIATKTEFTLDLKIALQKDLPNEVLSIIDKAIETISEKEKSDIYFKWTEVIVEEKIDWSLFYKFGGGALILILVVAYWNRRLKSAVDDKTAEIQKMLVSFDENIIASKTDTKGIITYASKAFCKISGYSHEELIGSPQNIIRHPDMPKTLFADLWSTIQSGQVWTGEVKNRTKEGGFYWVDLVVEPEYDKKHKIIGYSAIRHDITSKKFVEESSKNLEIKVEERTAELQKAQEQFSSMASNIPGVIYRCKIDESWTMLYVSNEIEKLSGYPVTDFIHNEVRAFSDIMHKDDIKSVALSVRKQIKKHNKFIVDYRIIDKEGTVKWVRNQGQIYKTEEGDEWLDGVLFDVTERRALEEEIVQNRLFLDTLLDSQEQIVITTDGKSLQSCNKSFLDFFGISNMEEFTKVNDCICDKFVIDESGQYLQKYMGDISWVDHILKYPEQNHKAVIVLDGKEHIFSVSAAELPLDSMELKSAVFTDITELETIRKNIETILSNIMLPVLITSKEDRTILYANDYASKQYETSVENLVGSSIDNVYTSLEQKDEILTIMAEEGFVENLEERYKTSTGKEFIGLLSVKPIIYDMQEAYIGMVVDITKQKEIEEELRYIHKHTQSSIEYASLIQHSLIPSNDLFRKYFDDYFAIWHPKDIVGGDIYLFEELRSDNECLLMVIDCTGHGVPGAFVTMLVKAIERQVSASIMSDASLEVSPAWILQYFNKTMKKLLKQEDDDAISNAGFDGAILYYNKERKIVRFAGAELPLFYREKDELKVIKGNRHSIGYKKSDANYEFKEHEIEVSKGMQFYLTTDGYLDQNGGEKGFPFGRRRFVNLLEESKEYSFADQQEVLLNELQAYQQNEERNDDISIVGIKI